LFYAAKLLYQTAKTCQYVKEFYKKYTFLIKDCLLDFSLLLFCKIGVLTKKKEQAEDETTGEKE